MHKIIIFFAIIFSLASCNSKDTDSKEKKDENDSLAKRKLMVDSTSIKKYGYLKSNGDSLTMPSFEIDLILSPKAEAKLKAKKESVIVMAMFGGTPKDTTTEDYQQSGEMGLGSFPIELTDSRVAKFENVKISKNAFDSLSNNDIHLLINVYSGRRSGPDNILNCDIVEDNMSNIKGKTFTVKGKLIGEK